MSDLALERFMSHPDEGVCDKIFSLTAPERFGQMEDEMTKEEFVCAMTGVKPEDQPVIALIEQLVDTMHQIANELECIGECINENAKMTDELGIEVFKLRADLKDYYGN